ncbi:MAG: zinc ABC transporter substrate-binding protein [Clostridiales bacterium]|nr:zinc ABC transporter substrate-binding protein [Clostridiales bacterium]
MKLIGLFVGIALLILGFLMLPLTGCSSAEEPERPMVAATTYPVAQFTQAICAGTDIEVERVITDSVSCLHEYSLSVRQAEAIERADAVILSGAGLEEFMNDALSNAAYVVDASSGIALLEGEQHHTQYEESDGADPHIWMDPDNAEIMVANIADGLAECYPDLAEQLQQNAEAYCQELQALKQEGQEKLAQLKTRDLITFHDGFAYFAQAFDLTILASIEEEAGAEASAQDLTEIVALVREYDLPAIFTEQNSTSAAASVVQNETGCGVGVLDLGMGEQDYFTAMRSNYDAVLEALG